MIKFKNGSGHAYVDDVALIGAISGKLAIDKIVLVATVPDDQLIFYEDYRAKVNLMTKIPNYDVYWDSRAGKNGYKNSLRIRIKGLDKQSFPLFQFDPYNKKSGYMRLEFNPRILGPDGVEALKLWGDLSSPHGWPAFLHWARVTRVDVCYDVEMPIGEVIWDSRYRVARQFYYANGDLESVYLGKKEWGKNFTRIYNWNAKHSPNSMTPLTRIERHQKPKCTLSELADLKNVFSGVRLFCSNVPAPEGFSPGLWSLFRQHLFQVGLQKSLFTLEKSQRAAIKKHVLKSVTKVIDFDQAWDSWGQVIDCLGLTTPGPHGPMIPFLDASIPKDLLGRG
ncbi:MAG: hypothetical protein JKX72_12600 [Robiginitomaculum sp.]|nr:hypothetical protein [Robiginitomaculum sp.]